MIGIKDQYFGTEIEMTGITRQRAAEVVAEMFGTEAYYDGTTYGIWSVIDLEGKKWKFMSDGSIYTQRKVYGRIVDAGGEYSTEMVSPKLSYDEMGKSVLPFRPPVCGSAHSADPHTDPPLRCGIRKQPFQRAFPVLCWTLIFPRSFSMIQGSLKSRCFPAFQVVLLNLQIL